jgi:hypothetical protein
MLEALVEMGQAEQLALEVAVLDQILLPTLEAPQVLAAQTQLLEDLVW